MLAQCGCSTKEQPRVAFEACPLVFESGKSRNKLDPQIGGPGQTLSRPPKRVSARMALTASRLMAFDVGFSDIKTCSDLKSRQPKGEPKLTHPFPLVTPTNPKLLGWSQSYPIP